ncbi:peptidylprolyl isomerase [Nostocaceae cyanobacterium CENA357]|uniref:peptidylprolyl isomerase n=1 Tax=Atlanticothrix silvestris CENA357 TaxID=1725252 RepID=A0A8J7L5F2_9CYAN|nr:peptidylprolyl isomerase [Atlanticothrix silvestris]MBH8555791.1 peptidylprolyl isomerase [Atlanticothrix silvestris CENA357]
MESTVFLTADDQPISLGQALRYLKSSGRLESVIWEIIGQYVIEQELQTIEEFDIGADLIDQVVMDFRLEHQLTDYKSFQEWLTSEGIDYTTFRKQITFNLKLETLKAQVTEPNIQEYFIERKIFLDRIVLSRLVTQEQALAEELKSQILEDGARFEQLVQEYSIEDDRIFNGMMGAVSRGTMPDVLRGAVDLANPGELIGPLEIDRLWYLVRVEKFLEASLEEQLKQELKDELFEQWLEEKIQNINVKLQVEF